MSCSRECAKLRTMAAEKKPAASSSGTPPSPITQDHVRLGHAIKLVIAEQGLSQSKVANRCKLDVRQINMYAQGLGNPTYLTLLHICDGLGVSPGELLRKAERLKQEESSGTGENA
jgi:DNA-binding Xre family transcriptional regulator